MEEDIKIIEELIEPFREQNRKGKKLILDIKGIKYEHYEAIENLIARYKELEEKQNKNIQVAYGGRRYNTEGIIIKDFISKSNRRLRRE